MVVSKSVGFLGLMSLFKATDIAKKSLAGIVGVSYLSILNSCCQSFLEAAAQSEVFWVEGAGGWGVRGTL